MVKYVDHINIVVSNLERSVHFYTQVLGLEETKRARLSGGWIERIVGLKDVIADVVFLQPRDGGPRIELLHYHFPPGLNFSENSLPNTGGLRHIAFQVDNMDELRTRMETAGVEFFGPPVQVPGGVVEHADGQKSLCYFLDPDGVLLELAAYDI